MSAETLEDLAQVGGPNASTTLIREGASDERGVERLDLHELARATPGAVLENVAGGFRLQVEDNLDDPAFLVFALPAPDVVQLPRSGLAYGEISTEEFESGEIRGSLAEWSEPIFLPSFLNAG